jgi:hypothetical protein
MRVQYTIAAMQPQIREELQASGTGTSFRGKLLRLSRSLPMSWKKILRLDRPPMGLEFVGPPLQPEDFESLTDPVAERLRWRQLLDGKARLLETASDDEQDSEKQRAIKQMLGLLLTYQVMEDELVARQLSASQE